MTLYFRKAPAVLAAVCILAKATFVLAQTAAPLSDVAGAKDDPLVGRFAGSALVGYQQLSFDQTRLPSSNEIQDEAFVKGQTIEGGIVRLAYIAPADKGVLEVSRNYENALVKAGLVKKFSCANASCGPSRIQAPFIAYSRDMKQIESYGGYSDMAFIVLNTSDDPRYFWGTLKSSGQEVDVSVFTSKISAPRDSPLNGRAGTFIEIIRPKAMETGQVTVDSKVMREKLATEGRIALYGIYFDSGNAEIKVTSKPQLDEMAHLLEVDQSIKVFIVGHTDNQGSLDNNLALSQRRADAVSATLVKSYRIDPKRIETKGVANLAPVDTNDTEVGRAHNRRVELVKQ